MEATGWISIEQVLQEMEKTYENGKFVTFSIAWVRNNGSTGGPKGSIKSVRRAAKYTNPAKRHQRKSTSTWQFKTYNTIPIQDRDNDKLQTPKITHIVEFNGLKVKHYGAEQ